MSNPVSDTPVLLEQELWLIAYDVESENSKALKPEQQDWLRSMRVAIWYALRYHYKCVPIQNSLWMIRDENTREQLEAEKDKWLGLYAKFDFRARIEIFPIKTNEIGYKTFKQWEYDFILEWLGKISKALNKALVSGKIGKKNVQAHTKKFQLLGNILNEDFDDTFPNWRLAQDALGDVQDLLHRVQFGG